VLEELTLKENPGTCMLCLREAEITLRYVVRHIHTHVYFSKRKGAQNSDFGKTVAKI